MIGCPLRLAATGALFFGSFSQDLRGVARCKSTLIDRLQRLNPRALRGHELTPSRTPLRVRNYRNAHCGVNAPDGRDLSKGDGHRLAQGPNTPSPMTGVGLGHLLRITSGMNRNGRGRHRRFANSGDTDATTSRNAPPLTLSKNDATHR